MGAVDTHNRYRQAGFALEEAFRTAEFERRVFCFLLGVQVTNAYAYWSWDARNRGSIDRSRTTFTNKLVDQLLRAAGV